MATATTEMLTTAEVAHRLGLHPETVREWIREGKIRGVKPDGSKQQDRWSVPAREVERLKRTFDRGDLLTIAQVSQRLGLHPRTIQDRIKTGQLKGSKLLFDGQRRWMVREADVEKARAQAADDARVVG